MASNLVGSSLRPSTRQLLSSSTRSFSTTPAVFSNNIPPESPSYIRIPAPPQSDEPKHERVRGFLPVPRELFPRRSGAAKLTKEYMERTAPKPTSQRHEQPKSKVGQWKSKMADARRENLDSGLQALWSRHKRDSEVRRVRARRRHEENRAAMLAPEREDDRITRSTVLDNMLDTEVYPDPERFQRAEESRKRVQEKDIAKQEERRDALMELYINASNFITQESQLKEEIDTIFSEDYFRKQSHAMSRFGLTENVWGVHGKPPTTATMLRATTGTSTKVMDVLETEFDRSAKLQKRIAEEFTGGKME